MATTDAHQPPTRRTAVPADLADDVAVPLLSGIQRQGDVLILPESSAEPGSTAPAPPIPPEGIEVIRGEATGHTHLLLGDGTWAARHSPLDLGIVEVATEAYLTHPEHAALGLAPGRYLLRRQREQSRREYQPVAD